MVVSIQRDCCRPPLAMDDIDHDRLSSSLSTFAYITSANHDSHGWLTSIIDEKLESEGTGSCIRLRLPESAIYCPNLPASTALDQVFCQLNVPYHKRVSPWRALQYCMARTQGAGLRYWTIRSIRWPELPNGRDKLPIDRTRSQVSVSIKCRWGVGQSPWVRTSFILVQLSTNQHKSSTGCAQIPRCQKRITNTGTPHVSSFTPCVDLSSSPCIASARRRFLVWSGRPVFYQARCLHWNAPKTDYLDLDDQWYA